MEPSSVSYVTPRCTGTRQGLNHQTRGFRNFKSVCLASFVLIPYKSISKDKGSFVINMPHIEVLLAKELFHFVTRSHPTAFEIDYFY